MAEHLWLTISRDKILTTDSSQLISKLLALGVSRRLISSSLAALGWTGNKVKRGMFSRDGLVKIIRQHVNLNVISSSPIPCYITCCCIPKLGYVAAYQQMGHMYELGLGTKENIQQARQWYEKAAEHNDAEAQNSLGDLYCYGQGVEKDFAKAVAYYRHSAENGDKNGQKNYGDMLILGLGIDEVYKEAEKWYLRSTEQGNAKAAFMLGKLYHFGGNNIRQDYTKAAQSYQQAAEKEHKHALNNLACLYFSGDGVDLDYFEAYIKFNEADDLDDEYAHENLDLLGEDYDLWEYSSFAPKAYYITEKV